MQKQSKIANQTFISPEVIDTTEILTGDSFSGNGLSVERPNPDETTFKININRDLPIYVFHVVSFTSAESGHVDVFSESDPNKLLQTIPLDLNMFERDKVPVFFNAADINFDGFLDIGVLVDGGAKWGAYQYWTFDQKTGKFIASPVTEDLKKIPFNFISFDAEEKQIITDNLEGAGWRTLYQFKDDHLFHIKDERLENLV